MQETKPKISVIIPVYNVEEYIAKACDSILNQSLSDFELFLVDDGSIDKSPYILDRYKEKDKRVKVIHQKNSGAFTARNNALKLASGDYVCFFDGDDYIDKDMLFDMYNLAIKYNANLVISGFYIHTYYDDNNFITTDYIPYTRDNDETDVFTDKESFRKYAYLSFDKNMFYPPWNKLYNLSYLKNNNILFPSTYRDDFPFVISTIKDIDRVVYTKKQYYHFIRKRSDSETQKFFPDLYRKREEEHLMMIELYKHWGLLDDKESMEMISRRYIDRLIECMTNLYNKDCKLTHKQKYDEFKIYLHSNSFNECIGFAKPVKIYLKLIYLLLKSKNIHLCQAMAKYINFVKNKNILLFTKLKFNR